MKLKRRINEIEWKLHDLIYNRVNLHASKLFELEERIEKLEGREEMEDLLKDE